MYLDSTNNNGAAHSCPMYSIEKYGATHLSSLYSTENNGATQLCFIYSTDNQEAKHFSSINSTENHGATHSHPKMAGDLIQSKGTMNKDLSFDISKTCYLYHLVYE